MIHVTRHAIHRYKQRVAMVTSEEVRRRIAQHERAFDIAVAFGAPVVKNSDGVRFVIQGGAVVTVLGHRMPLGPVANKEVDWGPPVGAEVW